MKWSRLSLTPPTQRNTTGTYSACLGINSHLEFPTVSSSALRRRSHRRYGSVRTGRFWRKCACSASIGHSRRGTSLRSVGNSFALSKQRYRQRLDTAVSSGKGMKHRRGIDLAAPFPPAEFQEDDGTSHRTLMSMAEWDVLGAKCGRCDRVSWLDHRALAREIGNQYLMHLKSRLRCSCGNKNGNKILVGKLPR